MKMRTRAGGRNLFLLELVIAILFFALSSAICMQLFAHAHEKSMAAKRLSEGVNLASAAGEVLFSFHSREEALSLYRQCYPNGEILETEDGFCLQGSGDPAGLTLKVCVSQREWMLHGDISVENENGEVVYRLTVSHHMQRGNGNGE